MSTTPYGRHQAFQTGGPAPDPPPTLREAVDRLVAALNNRQDLAALREALGGYVAAQHREPPATAAAGAASLTRLGALLRELSQDEGVPWFTEVATWLEQHAEQITRKQQRVVRESGPEWKQELRREVTFHKDAEGAYSGKTETEFRLSGGTR